MEEKKDHNPFRFYIINFGVSGERKMPRQGANSFDIVFINPDIYMNIFTILRQKIIINNQAQEKLTTILSTEDLIFY